MRILLFLGVISVIGLVVTGAIKLQNTPDHKLSIQIDKDRVKEDIREVVDEGKHIFQEARTSVKESDDEGNHSEAK